MVSFLRYFRSATVAIVAGTLIYLGIPRFISALVMLPSGPILNKIQTNKSIDAEALDILVQSQNRGLEWNESARRWTDLGLAQILLANIAENKENRMALFDQAEESLISGLSIGPSNAFAWTRLAYVDLTRNGLSPTVAQKLRLAVTRAPYDRRLVFTRLRMSIIAWSQFNKDTRLLILDQIRFAWNINPKRLVSLASELGRAGLIRAALFRNPDDMRKFEAFLKDLSRKKK